MLSPDPERLRDGRPSLFNLPQHAEARELLTEVVHDMAGIRISWAKVSRLIREKCPTAPHDYRTYQKYARDYLGWVDP